VLDLYLYLLCKRLFSAKEPGSRGSEQSNYVQVMSDGTCHWWPRFEMSVSHCPMNIAWFPFDEQRCDLVYESWRYRSSELNITAPETPVLLSHYKRSGEWNLIGKGAITSKIKYAVKLKTSPASLAGLVLSFIAYFILLVIAP